MSRKDDGRRNSLTVAKDPKQAESHSAGSSSGKESPVANAAISHMMRSHSGSHPAFADASGLVRSASEDTLSMLNHGSETSSLSSSVSGSSPSTPSRLAVEGRGRAGSDADLFSPPSPTRRGSVDGSRLEAGNQGKGSSPAKPDKKEALSKRLSQRLFGSSPSRSSTKGKSQPASYYVNILKKKTVSKNDMFALQEEIKSQPPAWASKFEDDGGTAAFESFMAQLGVKPDKSEVDLEVQQEVLRVAALLLSSQFRQSFPSVIKPSFMAAVCSSLSSQNKQLKGYTVTLLCDLLQLPKLGQQLVLDGLTALQEQRQESSKFMSLVGALMGSDVPADLKTMVMMLFNMLLANVEELEPRFQLRNEILSLGLSNMMADMKAVPDEDLQMQLEIFEEGTNDDFLLMSSRKRNIRAYVAKKESAYRPKNYFRVYITKDGVTTSTVIPFTEGKTVQDIIGTITNKHPVSDVSLYGILADKEGTDGEWLPDNSRIMEDLKLSGEVMCDFKLKDWNLMVRSPSGQTETVTLSPLLTASDAVSQLTRKFSLPSTEEYGLFANSTTFVRVIGTDGHGETKRNGYWLVDNKQLFTYSDLHQKGKVLELRMKPRALKIKFKDETLDSVLITGATLVKEVIHELANKVGIAHEQVSDWGLFLEGPKGSAGTWLDPEKSFATYGLQDGMGMVKFVQKPVPLAVVLPDKTDKTTLLLHVTSPVKEVIAEICEQAKLDIDEGFSLRRGAADDAPRDSPGSQLDDWKSLRDQNAASPSTILVLARDAKKKKRGDDGGVNIWEDKDEKALIHSEHLNKEGKREISCASLNKLVENLTSEKEYDIDLTKTFINTYRSFTTTELFMRKLQERWTVPATVDKKTAMVIKLRICTIIQHWLERLDDHSAIDPISAFVQKYVAVEEGFDNLTNKLRKEIENRRAAPKHRVFNHLTPPPPVLPLRQAQPVVGLMSILDIDELEAARQLTLPLFDMYSKIRPVELFGQAWNNVKTKDRSPHVCQVIDYFNRVAQWTACLILSESSLNNRVKLMRSVITLAQRLRELNNYHLMTAIVSGLSNSAVLRLKWTRLKLPKQISKSLEELEELTNMEGSYRNFRRELEHVVLPCLPYVGVYLMDLTFIEDGNPDIKGNLINWEKRKLVNNIIGQIQKFQLAAYNLQRDEKIQAFFAQAFTTCAGLTDRDLYAKSLEYEPRNAQRADIK